MCGSKTPRCTTFKVRQRAADRPCWQQLPAVAISRWCSVAQASLFNIQKSTQQHRFHKNVDFVWVPCTTSCQGVRAAQLGVPANSGQGWMPAGHPKSLFTQHMHRAMRARAVPSEKHTSKLLAQRAACCSSTRYVHHEASKLPPQNEPEQCSSMEALPSQLSSTARTIATRSAQMSAGL